MLLSGATVDLKVSISEGKEDVFTRDILGLVSLSTILEISNYSFKLLKGLPYWGEVC